LGAGFRLARGVPVKTGQDDKLIEFKGVKLTSNT
jgi:hypothetical protein